MVISIAAGLDLDATMASQMQACPRGAHFAEIAGAAAIGLGRLRKSCGEQAQSLSRYLAAM